MIWNLIKNKPPQKKDVILRVKYDDGKIGYIVAYWQREIEGDRRKIKWILSCCEFVTIGYSPKITHWADLHDITFPKKRRKKVINRFELMEL